MERVHRAEMKRRSSHELSGLVRPKVDAVNARVPMVTPEEQRALQPR